MSSMGCGRLSMAANDKQVVALIQYAMGDDPTNVTAAYMASEYFAEDMSGFSFSNFESTVTAVMDPTSFSPVLVRRRT